MFHGLSRKLGFKSLRAEEILSQGRVKVRTAERKWFNAMSWAAIEGERYFGFGARSINMVVVERFKVTDEVWGS